MHGHLLKIALAVMLGLGVLSVMPTELGKRLPDQKLPVPPPVTAEHSPARDVGRIACRKDTGEFAGMVDTATFDGTRWVYTLLLPSMSNSKSGQRRVIIETLKSGQQQTENSVPLTKEPDPVPASEYFVIGNAHRCPDGQPAPPTPATRRWNRDRIIRCTPELPHTRNASTDPRCPPQVVR